MILSLVCLGTKFDFERVAIDTNCPGVWLCSRHFGAHEACLLLVELCCARTAKVGSFLILSGYLLFSIVATSKENLVIMIFLTVQRGFDLLL